MKFGGSSCHNRNTNQVWSGVNRFCEQLQVNYLNNYVRIVSQSQSQLMCCVFDPTSNPFLSGITLLIKMSLGLLKPFSSDHQLHL